MSPDNFRARVRAALAAHATRLKSRPNLSSTVAASADLLAAELVGLMGEDTRGAYPVSTCRASTIRIDRDGTTACDDPECQEHDR